MALFESNDTGGTDIHFTIEHVAGYYLAQTFTPDTTHVLSGIALHLSKSGAYTGEVFLAIKATDDDGEPTGPDLSTGSHAIAITTYPTVTWYTITMTAMVLVANTKYAFIINCDGAGGVNLAYAEKTTGDLYPNATKGQTYQSTDNRVTWGSSGNLDWDFYFREYGDSCIPVDKTYSRKLIAIGANEVWQEVDADPMEMEKIATATGLDVSDVLNAAVMAQKLFIVNGTIRKVLDFVNTKIVTDDVGTHPPDFGTVITSDGAGNPSMIVDYITHETADGECTIYGKRTTTATFANGDAITGTNPSTSPYVGDISFDLTADEADPPHWYDYTVFGNNTDDADNFGVMPTIAYGICKYRGRIQLCRDPNYPHQWYQSRQLNPFDFLYVAGDAQSPVAGNNADCTEVGDIVVVAIPYSDDYLIYGCANELWVMSGDAAFGGELNPLDTTTGILGDRAWCWDDKVNLYMIGTAGLLRIPKGFGQIENLTRELWPDFIEDLAFDSSLHRITLAFDPEQFGIHIFKTTLATGTCIGWWYDLRTEGLFPDAIPTAMGIYSAVYYQTESPLYRKLLFGCADGYIKSFDKNTKNDDDTIITSYVGFAPLALSTHPRKDGIIKNIDIVTGIGDTDTDGVTCTVHVARTAGQIIKKLDDGDTAAFTKVFTAPNWTKSNLDRRSVRGQWAAIVLTNAADDESWSMERLIVDSKEIGRSL